jgi:catechol 2,3-dioxygenase-like lactoylglutathione lyase family enzyme
VKPKNLDHVVFAVHDLDAAAADWKRLFDLELTERHEPESIKALLGLMSIGGPGSKSALLELAQPAAGDGPVAVGLEQRGEGMLSISIAVDDIDGAVAELRAGGVVEISDVVDGPLPNTRVARLTGDATHGVRMQLMERLP